MARGFAKRRHPEVRSPSRALPGETPLGARRNKPVSRLEHLLFCRVGQAIGDHGLIEPEDRILVAISGGKDSFSLLHLLDLHRRRAPFEFSLLPVFVDAGWDEGAGERVTAEFSRHGYTVEIFRRDIRGCVRDHLRPGTNPCALCSRLRRGVLYDLAPARGCNKLALGHHLDDLIETLLLNLFYSGQLKAMGINLLSDDRRNRVIRPLCYIEEEALRAFAAAADFHAVEIACPYRDGSRDPRREAVKHWIAALARDIPELRRSALAALKHVRPTHLLDRALFSRRSPGPQDGL